LIVSRGRRGSGCTAGRAAGGQVVAGRIQGEFPEQLAGAGLPRPPRVITAADPYPTTTFKLKVPRKVTLRRRPLVFGSWPCDLTSSTITHLPRRMVSGGFRWPV
jgi:hypothetical protein